MVELVGDYIEEAGHRGALSVAPDIFFLFFGWGWQRQSKLIDEGTLIMKRIIAVLASIVAVIAVIAGLIGNVKTIADGVNSVFGLDFSAKVLKVCMGNGEGVNCLNGADAKFDCDHYKAMGGGAEPQTENALAAQLCPSKRGTATVYQDNTGGQCGWTGFQLTCKRLWWPF